jgi:hypothetical protein
MDGGKRTNPSVPAGDDEPTKMKQLEDGKVSINTEITDTYVSLKNVF